MQLINAGTSQYLNYGGDDVGQSMTNLDQSTYWIVATETSLD